MANNQSTGCGCSGQNGNNVVRRSNGITDNSLYTNTICILADRVFDGIRADLDQTNEVLLLDVTNTEDPITVESARSAGSECQVCNVSITPFDDTYSVVICDIIAPGTCTYLQNGTPSTANCQLVIPFSALMQLPDESILPYVLSAQCNFVSDEVTQTDGNRFNALVDGMVLTLVTGQIPVYVPFINQFVPAPIGQRQYSAINDMFTAPVFPSKKATDCNTSPIADNNGCENSTL